MNTQRLLYWLLVIISVATVISGVAQMLRPAFILHLISAEVTPTTEQCFGIVGMFMALFGGMLLQVLLIRKPLTPVFLWAGLQKLGAAAAVSIGLVRHLFGPLAVAIIAFDFSSGVLIFVYLRILHGERSTP
jgi:hypothetical protein